MSSPEERIQVLYELSLSIGSEGDLAETARTALSAYLRKLNCSAGAVFERRPTSDGGATYETVTMIPSRAPVCEGLEAAIGRLSTDDGDALQASLPITDETDTGARYYIMSLPDFGVIILVSRTESLEGETVAALGPLNEKLATACRGERYEDRLREERDRFETIFTTIDEPLVSVRPDDGTLRVQRVNPAFETTFDHDERVALGRPLESLLGSAWPDDEVLPLGDTNHSVTTKIRWETIDGVDEFLVRATPINRDDRGTEILVLFVNVTEAATRRRRLERFHEVTKALARILRHNIRNDLTVIRAMAERLRDGTEGQLSEDAQTILDKSDQLASTAEKAREMRKLVATYDRRPSVPVRSALRDAIDSVRQDYADADIALEVAVDDGIRITPSIGMAVRHLVENGIEHHDGAGEPHVAVSVESGADTVSITVRDNGPGIPRSEVETLEQHSETQLSHGAGAGLWIVGQIIDHCDATLEFSTDDCGTTATITVAQ